MNILKWIYILYLTQIKILRQKLCVDKAFNKLIIRWTYQTTQINELASLNDTFKIGSECEGWGQNNVAWSGVGGGGAMTPDNAFNFIVFRMLLFFKRMKDIPQWKVNFWLYKLPPLIFLFAVYRQNKRTYSQNQIFRTTIELRVCHSNKKAIYKNWNTGTGRNAGNIWQNSP